MRFLNGLRWLFSFLWDWLTEKKDSANISIENNIHFSCKKISCKWSFMTKKMTENNKKRNKMNVYNRILKSRPL